MNLQRQTYFSVSSKGVPIRNIADYSPFGVQLDGRTISGDFYRFGYQGSEKDDESKEGGNSYTTYYRQLDPRVGRWFSIDPVFQPWQSPYCSMDGNPIVLCDPLGDWIPSVYYTTYKDEKTGKTKTQGVLVAKMEKGDNASTLADFLDVSLKEAKKMYKNISNKGMVIINTPSADIINKVIEETLNPSGNDYVDDWYIADKFEENYNCWESTLKLAKGKEPDYDNCIDEGRIFASSLRNTENFSNVSKNPKEWKFGETAIRFAEDHKTIFGTSWNETTHGATYLGTSKNGTIYVWSKEGRIEVPQVMTLDNCKNHWGKVQGSGPTINEGGFYNYIGE